MERTMGLYMEVSDAAESELQEFVLAHLKDIRYGFMQIGFVLWQLKNFSFTKDIVRYAREHFGFYESIDYRCGSSCIYTWLFWRVFLCAGIPAENVKEAWQERIRQGCKIGIHTKSKKGTVRRCWKWIF